MDIEKKSVNDEFGEIGSTTYFLYYYQRPFALFHEELIRTGFNTKRPHPIRKQYWSLLPNRRYEPLEARPLLLAYITSVENELKRIIGKNSLAYWLHLYRRLYPGPIGENEDPATIGIIRGVMEAAIQKHAKFDSCNRIGVIGDIPVSKVLNGILMSQDFLFEREHLLLSDKQLVLTNFSTNELRQFYNVERLAYEIWRSSAMLRIIGKGAPIVVEDFEYCVYDVRSEELDKLVTIFDARDRIDRSLLSSTGVVFNYETTILEDQGIIFLPFYNLGKRSIGDLESLFDIFKIWFTENSKANPLNFIWLPFALRQFRNSHAPFADAFRNKFDVSLDAVLAVVAALWQRIFFIWLNEENKMVIINYWQRAYEGPYSRDYVNEEIQGFLFTALDLLGLSRDQVDEGEISKAIKFWELTNNTRAIIDLAYAGPHSIFLPYGKDRLFIDYAGIFRRFYHLFLDVNIPDQNFKGEALEELIRGAKSILPIKGCKAYDGSKKQIDAAFEINDRLLIVECKAIGKSVGFTRGDPKSIQFRNCIVNDVLEQVDEKARWLSLHPVGTNYDVRNFKDILPIAVTPFVEYIPSLSSRYWLTNDLPRVMTPNELKVSLENGEFNNQIANVIPIQKREKD